MKPRRDEKDHSDHNSEIKKRRDHDEGVDQGRRPAFHLAQAIDQPAANAQTRQNLALLLALKGDPNSAERLARKDLPPELADSNTAYYRMISSAAGGKGGAPVSASAILPETMLPAWPGAFAMPLAS